MNWMSLAADLIGILGVFFSFGAWLKARQIQRELEEERKRQGRGITVVLQSGGKRIELPVELRRAELSRAEVLGRIGMIPMKESGKRFSLEYLNTPEFLRQLNQVITGQGEAILTIPCKNEELEQFNLKLD